MQFKNLFQVDGYSNLKQRNSNLKQLNSKGAIN